VAGRRLPGVGGSTAVAANQAAVLCHANCGLYGLSLTRRPRVLVSPGSSSFGAIAIVGVRSLPNGGKRGRKNRCLRSLGEPIRVLTKYLSQRQSCTSLSMRGSGKSHMTATKT
jgi:hypothetical protein